MRLFVAVELDRSVIDAVARTQAQVTRHAPDAKWVAPEKQHVTLVFLGSVDEQQLPALTEVIRATAKRHAPMVLEVKGGGGFGSRRTPRVLWIGFGGALEAFARLQADLAEGVRGLGFELEDREFRPHLTLARARSPRGDSSLGRCVPELEAGQYGETKVTELVLFRSRPSPGGSLYEALLRAPLAAP